MYFLLLNHTMLTERNGFPAAFRFKHVRSLRVQRVRPGSRRNSQLRGTCDWQRTKSCLQTTTGEFMQGSSPMIITRNGKKTLIVWVRFCSGSMTTRVLFGSGSGSVLFPSLIITAGHERHARYLLLLQDGIDSVLTEYLCDVLDPVHCDAARV